METGDVSNERVYMSPSASAKDLLETRMEKKIQNMLKNQTTGHLSENFQSNQPILNPIW